MNSRFSRAALAALALAAACSTEQSTESGATPDITPELSREREPESHRRPGFVITATNAVAGNQVVVYPRAANGSLGSPASYPTGGIGTGGGLGNQEGIALDDDSRHLYVVNAGSNTISVFAVRGDGLALKQTIASGGTRPISVAVSDRLLYVLNNGGTANITGFRVRHDGTLRALSYSTQPLSTAAPNASQVGFNRSERRLIVTEKATNNLLSFRLDEDGRPGPFEVTPSSGMTPFGFAVDRRGHVLVSEAFGGTPNASALSSYRLRRGRFQTISASVPTTETAACWVAFSGDGRYAYVTNTASNTISGYALSDRGELRLLVADGISGTTGKGPVDLATRPGLDYMYSLNSADGSISAFRVNPDGSLVAGATTSGLPVGSNGLVVF